MNPVKENIINGYRENLDNFKKLEQIVCNIFVDTFGDLKKGIMQLTHRIKSEESLAGKIARKPEKYRSIFDISDILGFRIICYFSDQVDNIAELISSSFEIDRENSIDKRKIMDPSTFGYMSLHYICMLPDNEKYDDELKKLRFEIQIKSVLQHTWAEIEHDLGYKNEFGIPKDARREFARVASLLETADDAFIRIRKRVSDYVVNVREKISNDDADNLTLDIHTLTVFLEKSRMMNDFNRRIADISGAAIIVGNPESYFPQLEFLGIDTIGDIKRLLTKEQDHAYALARRTLENSEIDELASTVGLYYLCRASLIFGGHEENYIRRFFGSFMDSDRSVERNTARLLKLRAEFTGEK